MPTKYEHASTTPYGSALLTPGAWFAEAQRSKLNASFMAELHNAVRVTDVLDDVERDWIMFALEPLTDAEVPRDVMLVFGQVQKIPDGMSLSDVKADLYGGEFLEPVSMFEWLATNYPQGFQLAIDAAEAAKAVGENVSKGVGVGVGGVVAVGVGLWFALRLLGR